MASMARSFGPCTLKFAQCMNTPLYFECLGHQDFKKDIAHDGLRLVDLNDRGQKVCLGQHMLMSNQALRISITTKSKRPRFCSI